MITPLPEIGRRLPPRGMQRMFTNAPRVAMSIFSKDSGSDEYGDSVRTATAAGGVFSFITAFGGAITGFFGVTDLVEVAIFCAVVVEDEELAAAAEKVELACGWAALAD